MSKLAHFTDLDFRYKADLEALSGKYERILCSSSLPSVGTDNPMSYSDQLVSLHQMKTKLELEQKENDRLIQIYRMQNESLETKCLLYQQHTSSLEKELAEARAAIKALRDENVGIVEMNSRLAMTNLELDQQAAGESAFN